MSDFVQERHKPHATLDRPRELIVACPPMRSNVNLSAHRSRGRLLRAVARMIGCGKREGGRQDRPRRGRSVGDRGSHRTLPPVLEKLRRDGYQIVGLEQTTNAKSIFEFAFQRRTVLVVGNERSGIEGRGLAAVGLRGGDSRLWAALRSQRGHRRRDGPF